MANPNTTAAPAAKTIVDQSLQQYAEIAQQLNRDLFALWTSAAEASLRTTFELQHATLTRSQALVEKSATLSKDAFARWAGFPSA